MIPILSIPFLKAASFVLAGLGILFITIKVDQVTDYKIWLLRATGKRISHGLNAMLLRSIGFFPACYVSWWLPFHNWWVLIAGGIFFGFLYLMCFNGFFNNKRYMNWWNLGTSDPTEKDDKTGEFLKMFSPVMQKVIVLGGNIASLIHLIIAIYITKTPIS